MTDWTLVLTTIIGLTNRLERQGLLNDRRLVIVGKPNNPYITVDLWPQPLAAGKRNPARDYHFAVRALTGELYAVAGDGSVSPTAMSIGAVE